MLDLFSKIFGGSQQSQQSTATSTATNMNPFTDALSPQLLSLFKQGTPAYDGPLTTPAGANENNILGQLMGQTGPGTNRSGYLDSVLSGNFLPGQSGQNPFFDAAVRAAQRPTLEGLEETLTRSLPGRFTAAGQMTQANDNGQGGSSAFDRSAAIATRGVANAVGDIATNMGNAQYGQERQLQQQAVPLSQQEVSTSIQNLQAQALPRMIQELGIDRGLALFQQNTQALLNFLATISGTAKPVIGNNSESQSTGTGESTPGAMAGVTNAFKAAFPAGA